MNIRENLGSYVVIGALLIFAALVITQVISCSTSRPEMADSPFTTVQIGDWLYRTIDSEFNVICYHDHYMDAIDCLELPQ